MFNLEQQISAWRSRMLAAGIRAPVPLDELEAHLRDDIAQQIQSGIDPETAFETATQKIGKATMLKNEFNKNTGLSVLAEKLMIAAALLCVAFIIFLGGLAVFYCYSDWNDRVMAAVPMACTVLVAWGWTRVAPRLPVIANARKRAILGIGCIAFGFAASGLFCNFILPHFENSPDRQIPAVGFWAAFIIAVFACLGLALAMDERARARLGTLVSQHMAVRAKNVMLSFAGIPDHYVSMDGPAFKLDSRSATYLRTLASLLPIVILWLLASVYVTPQFNKLWQNAGTYTALPFGNIVHFNFAAMFFVKDHVFLIAGMVILVLALLEWRSRGWPRYRRAVIGAGVFAVNLTIVLSFAIMFLGATLTASWLSPHARL
jgi:hypothetical protein